MARVAAPGGTSAPARGTISGDALKYKGLGYVYGGNASRPGDWDCSSYPSYVLGHDLGMRLPGGGKYGDPGYPPNAHGPTVIDWARWNGARAVRSPEAGDLCCWVGEGTQGHMGFAISGTHMISALDQVDGTQVTVIRGTGPAGAPLVFRRVKGAPGGAAAGVSGPGAGRGAGVGALVGLALAGGSVGLLFVGAAVAGLVIALAGSAAIAALAIGGRSRAE